MCQFPVTPPESETSGVNVLPKEYIQIIDWFVLEGAEVNEEQLPIDEHKEVRLEDVTYFISWPTCCNESYYLYDLGEDEYDDCVVEVAAIAVQGAPYPTTSLERLVEPVQIISDNHFIEIEVLEETEGMVWVIRRFTKAQLASDDFHNMMEYFIGVTKDVRRAVFSNGY